MQVNKNQAIVNVEDLKNIISYCDKVEEHLSYLNTGNISHTKPLARAANKSIKTIVINKLIGKKKRNASH